jgi:hypothetical protein
MGYLITQIIICLLIAAIIGFIIGWLLRGLGCNDQETYGDNAYEGGTLGREGGVSYEGTRSDTIKTPDVNTLSSTGAVAGKGEAYKDGGSDSIKSSSGINTLSSAGAGEASTEPKPPVTKAPAKSHQIERIEGVGKSLGNYLRNIGVKTTADLIEKCSTDSGFKKVVKAAEVVEPVVKQWVSMADLMRVPNINGQYAELLEASDIKSVQNLASADAHALTAKMQTVNQREHRIPDSIPLADANMVANWVRDAKTLPRKI